MWLPRSLTSAAALLAWSAVLPNAAAQVTTECNPMEKDCPPDPALSTEASFNFNRTPSFDIWKTTVGPVEWSVDNGATFTIKKQGDSPTIQSKFYIFGGRTEIWMKASHGTGIISSVMFISDNLDEIDWEFFGGNDGEVQSNYFGKGIHPEKTDERYHPVKGGVQSDYHNYTTDWTKDWLDFYIDGEKVRRLHPKDANNTYNYPQTPMKLSIGIWAGGDPSLPDGTREWAGGTTDYSQGPYSMYVKSVQVKDYSSGKEYVYGDRSGTWDSIKTVEGNSTIKEVINAPPDKTLSDRWNELPQGSKIAIYASVAGFFGLLFAVGLFYCIRQRRHGAREAKIAEAKAESERVELERFKKAGIDPDSFTSQASEYNAKEMRRGGTQDDDSYSIADAPAVSAASPLDFSSNMGSGAAIGGGAALAGAGAGAAAMRSPLSNSNRAASPSIYSERGGGGQQAGANRSYSSPNAQMRVGSPAPSQHGFGGMDRVGSPQPQRSFTTDGYGGDGGGAHNGGYGNGNGGGGNQGYWGNGGGGGYR